MTSTLAPASAASIEDALDRRLGDELEAAGVDAEPARALGHLAHGFLAGRVQHGLVAARARRRIAGAASTCRCPARRRSASPSRARGRRPGRGRIRRIRSPSAFRARSRAARSAPGARRAAASRRPAPRTRASAKGASVFHSPQDGHWPLHRGASAPQDEQTNTVRGLAMEQIRDREAAMLACDPPPDRPTRDCGAGRGFGHKLLKIRPVPGFGATDGPFMIHRSGWQRTGPRMPDDSSRGGWLRGLSGGSGKKSGDASPRIGKPLVGRGRRETARCRTRRRRTALRAAPTSVPASCSTTFACSSSSAAARPRPSTARSTSAPTASSR